MSNKLCCPYTRKVMAHFKSPHNFGEIKDADGVGKVGNKQCGDVMYLYIKIKNNKIVDIKFQTFGCVAAIATSSIITDMAKGKTIAQAKKLTKESIVKKLGGLPPIKYHCSILAIDALQEAIKDYEVKKK